MSSQQKWRWITAAAAGAAILGCLSLAFADEPAVEVFTAFGVNMGSTGGGRTGGGSAIVTVIIERWSTEAERQALIQAFKDKGADGLLSALQKAPRLGTLRTPNTLGWDLHYAVQVPTEDGGRRILVATDRRIAFEEASRDARSMDYPFTLVELRLDKNDKGEGRMSLATKIARSKDGKTLELENYGSEAVRLQNVRKQKD